ncbi:GNAT family N-acetyltransferase [Paenibacillus rigui]|uniref:GNAT family N-acetyltransferase n=1 Tax=Paenibacillus rigui TaxID=554312 RepID=A0A229UP65_9BACL|nr:GNAT family N-acetyltransferase [Paenibacillus rigui]OXM85327.1 GNAT family N-acetyltransferase [Paenibacillus rigui]
MHIRRARQADARHIAELSNQLGYAATEEQIEERLMNLLSDEVHAVFVMEAEEEVVGWAHIQGRHLIESAAFAEIGGLVVHSRCRGQGIGRMLMRACEDWAREQKYGAVRVRSGGQRLDAHRFYEQIGYTRVKSQEVFDLHL